MLHNLRDLLGFAIRATDGDIGSVADIYFDERNTLVRYLVIDTGGWLSGRLVLLTPGVIEQVDASARELATGLIREQVENSPPVDSARPVSRQREIELHDHYGWEPYWGGASVAGGFPTAWGFAEPALVGVPPGADLEDGRPAADEQPGDPNLRSGQEIVGYHVGATDDDIGHVEDLVIDDEGWCIRHLVIDTRNWLPGRKVLIDPRSVRHIDWAERRVRVDLDREQIERSPEYDPGTIADEGHL